MLTLFLAIGIYKDIQQKECITLKLDYETAKEFGAALLDAVDLAEKYNEEVSITVTKSNKWVAIVGDADCGTRYKVDPPPKKPKKRKLKVVV